jgi:hypothetical protein
MTETTISAWTYYDFRGTDKWLVCQECERKGQEMFAKHVTLSKSGNSSSICIKVSCGGCLNGDSPGAPVGNKNYRKRRSG